MQNGKIRLISMSSMIALKNDIMLAFPLFMYFRRRLVVKRRRTGKLWCIFMEVMVSWEQGFQTRNYLNKFPKTPTQ